MSHLSYLLVVGAADSERERIVANLSQDFNLLFASSQEESISILGQHLLYELVILVKLNAVDVPVPQLLASFCELGALPYTILIVSKESSSRDIIEAMRAGASDILEHSFHPQELRLAIRKAFEHRSFIENLNREIERATQSHIKQRLEKLSALIKERKAELKAIHPSEIRVLFPYVDYSDMPTFEQAVSSIENGTAWRLAQHFQKPKILIVDDEPNLQLTLQLALEQEFELVISDSAEAALKVMVEQKEAIHLVLLDIGLPGKSGDEIVGQILALSPSTIVVMLTSYGDLDLIAKTIQAGATDYLIKPFINRELVEILSRIIENKWMTQTLAHWMGVAVQPRLEVTE